MLLFYGKSPPNWAFFLHFGGLLTIIFTPIQLYFSDLLFFSLAIFKFIFQALSRQLLTGLFHCFVQPRQHVAQNGNKYPVSLGVNFFQDKHRMGDWNFWLNFCEIWWKCRNFAEVLRRLGITAEASFAFLLSPCTNFAENFKGAGSVLCPIVCAYVAQAVVYEF